MGKKSISFTILAVILLMSLLFFYRSVSVRHLDDLNPNIPCEKKLIDKADYLAVIPLYQNKSIAENREWCEGILRLNKALIMHGVYHTYNEFNEGQDKEYVEKGIKEFEKCFGYKPVEFKPPQLVISEENKKLLEKEFNFEIHTWFTQRFHKVYHCDDDGLFPNWLADLI